MRKPVHRRPEAIWDLIGHSGFIGQTDPAAAEDFLDHVDSTFTQLADMPGVGGIWLIDPRRKTEIRWMSIRKFKKYLIFYVETDKTVEVVRVLHASQNINTILSSSLS